MMGTPLMRRKLTRQERILLWICRKADERLLTISDREWEKNDRKVLENFTKRID